MTRLFSLFSILALVTASLAQGPIIPIYIGAAFVEAAIPREAEQHLWYAFHLFIAHSSLYNLTLTHILCISVNKVPEMGAQAKLCCEI